MAAPPMAGLGALGDVCLVFGAFAVALWLRPWRGLMHGPPWPWVAAWALLPAIWCLDRLLGSPVVPLLSLSPVLVLLAGWPLAIVALLPAGIVATLTGDLGWVEGLHRLVWLGVVPATLMLGLGAASRRWLPRDPFAYILGRGFFATFLATMLAGTAVLAMSHADTGLWGDRMIAQLLTAFGEAFLSGMLVAGLVAFRPTLLKTYADRLYLGR